MFSDFYNEIATYVSAIFFSYNRIAGSVCAIFQSYSVLARSVRIFYVSKSLILFYSVAINRYFLVKDVFFYFIALKWLIIQLLPRVEVKQGHSG